ATVGQGLHAAVIADAADRETLDLLALGVHDDAHAGVADHGDPAVLELGRRVYVVAGPADGKHFLLVFVVLLDDVAAGDEGVAVAQPLGVDRAVEGHLPHDLAFEAALGNPAAVVLGDQ